ncbi:serine hydrolase domain-containing protein [Saccharibacillus deserti]|uniref:serine hydrolase domain-containing protein n=1 Tax=Saccharibacillus deserti TaxID=1634444 RepID=UPI0015580D01|nr:serine hydrolase domain-containing protein [Saccharibacillus deserti]
MTIVNSDKKTLAEKVAGVIDQALQEGKIVGTVTLISRNGKRIYSRAAGYADREAGIAMQEDALFRLASLTKPIVSTAALALIAQGTLQLDDPVTRWLPEFRPRLENGQEPTITVRQLLTHTAGLGYGFLESEKGGPYARAGVSDGMDVVDFSLEENLIRLSSAPLKYMPGTAWGYSIATDVLGALLEKAYGAPLQNIVQDKVTGPLNMTETSFFTTNRRKTTVPYLNTNSAAARMGDTEIAQVFEHTAGIRFQPERAFLPSAYPSGGAGMVGTAQDFLRFLEELRTGHRLLPKEWKDEMSRIQTGDLHLDGWPGRGFGLGFTVLRDPAAAETKESPGTWRLGGAYGHSWFVDPAEKLTVVSLTNTAFEGMSGLFTAELTESVYG